MPLRSASDYIESLRDSRRVVYQGRSVPDVTAHPELRVAIDHAAIDYELADAPEHRGLAVFDHPEWGETSAYYRLPRSVDDLLARSALIETATALGGTLVLLIKEIGTDALFALQRLCSGEELERVQAFHARCATEDLAVCVAQTDPKGDRALGPTQQADPDLYLHVVGESSEGLVVRGAKCHTSVSVNADELIVLPTRAMRDDAADYAISFSVPVDTDGLTFYVSAYGAGERDEFQFPISATHKMLESLTVFDDVVVPWDRVYLDRRPEVAGPLASAFVEYHRFTATSYKLPLLDTLVGCALEIAEMNGTAKVAHIRDKIARLVNYAETVRALTHAAARSARVDDREIATPDPLLTNMAKFTFATGYHEAIQRLQDCAGGLLVTGPGDADWADPEHRRVFDKYYAAAAPAARRIPMMNLIADLTARDFGGYQAVLATHAEGSIEAEKLHMLAAYDDTAARALARRLGRLE